MSVFAPSLSSLYQQIQALGIDPDPLFLKEGVDPSVIFDSHARVAYDKCDRIAARAARQSKDPFFGLREAEYFRPAHLGALGFAWLASPTLRQALARLTRFAKMLHERFKVELEERNDTAFVWIDMPLPSRDPSVRDDASLAVLAKMCRIIHGPDWHPGAVYFMHPEPQDSSGYYGYFRCPVHFGAERNGFSLPSALLDQRLTGADEQLALMNDHIVVKYLAHADKNDVVNQVKTRILEGIADGNATEAAVANALNTTPRSLHRKLAEHGGSFKQLLTETRKELAERYINDQTLTLTEISFLLGFAEASSFSRAYKRWNQVSPSEARRALS